MRSLSQTIKDVLASNTGQTKDVIKITIPAQTGLVVYPQTTLYLANGEGVFINGQAYSNMVRSIGSVKYVLGKASDSVDITLENVSRTLGFTLTDTKRALDGSKIEIGRAFNGAVGWEVDTYYVGYIRDIKINQETIQLSTTSDFARIGTSVAGVTMTQRCLLTFNKSGNNPNGKKCGWTTGQPGNPYACDKGVDTANGCKSHGNLHRFGGVPAFTVLASGNNGYDTGGGGWGDGSDGGFCVDLDTWILVSRDSTKIWAKAFNLLKGDKLISINKFGRLVETKIVDATIGETSTLFTISTKEGYSLSCSPTHPVMNDVSMVNGISVNTLKLGDEVVVYDFKNEVHFKDKVTSIEKFDKDRKVLLLELETPYHLFISGKETNGGIVSHNLKNSSSSMFNDYNRYTGIGEL